jgi:phosphate transport system permease protein
VLAWLLVEPRLVVALVVDGLPGSYENLSAGELNLLINNIKNLASGDVVSVDVDATLQEAATLFKGLAQRRHCVELNPISGHETGSRALLGGS